jgi:hypothetical protein
MVKKIIITEMQSDKLYKPIQKLIDKSVKKIKMEAEDWGMDAMDEIHEVTSVDRIEIDRIDLSKGMIKVYVNVYINGTRNDFDNFLNELEYYINNFLPSVTIIENEIINDNEFGPGIDW